MSLGDADHVANRIVRIGPDDEIRRRKEEEVQKLVFRMSDGLHEFPQLLRRGRRRHPETPIHRLVGRQMMHPRANPANAAYNPRDFFGGLSFDKFFKAPKGHDVHPRIADLARIVQLDLDRRVPFDARDGLDMDQPTHGLTLLSLRGRDGRSSRCAPAKRKSDENSGSDFTSIPLDAKAFSMSSMGLPSWRTGP